MTADLRDLLQAAIRAKGVPTSDYDLNPRTGNSGIRSLVPAGVLVPIISRDGYAHVILTKRSSALRHHPGQIAFPGGKQNADDVGTVGAAIREAGEEIGLRESQADLLGELPAHETVTGFSVTPVLALIEGNFTPTPEPGEVEEVFEVPLSHLSDPSRYAVQSRLWRGEERKYFTVAWGPYYIWGATARMLRALTDRMADASHR